MYFGFLINNHSLWVSYFWDFFLRPLWKRPEACIIFEITIQMMRIKKLSIPEPCHQSWQQMTDVQGGRHCESCSKTVVDFTRMSNDEIINYLSVSGRVCGRFDNDQFHGLSARVADEDRNAGWKKWLMAVAFVSASFITKANIHIANTRIERTEQLPLSRSPESADTIKKSNELPKERVINGRVVDESGSPLPGAQVQIQGTTIDMVTNADGCFSFKVPFSANTLMVRFIGYENIYFNIQDKAIDTCVIKMKPSRMLMGEVVVTRQPFFKRVYYRFVKRPIGKIFGACKRS